MTTDHMLEEVGQQFSVTRERIRQIEAKALGKLKHPGRSRKLRSWTTSLWPPDLIRGSGASWTIEDNHITKPVIFTVSTAWDTEASVFR